MLLKSILLCRHVQQCGLWTVCLLDYDRHQDEVFLKRARIDWNGIYFITVSHQSSIYPNPAFVGLEHQVTSVAMDHGCTRLAYNTLEGEHGWLALCWELECYLIQIAMFTLSPAQPVYVVFVHRSCSFYPLRNCGLWGYTCAKMSEERLEILFQNCLVH